MKALVYHGPGQKTWEEKPKPQLLEPTDAIVRVHKTTICGTDLHILKGDVPTVTPGRTLGHEGIGIVDEVGSAVANFRPGDKALISCITSCGRCPPCKEGMYSHCINGGWILGNQIDGTQAEYVRIPYADTSLYHLPKGVGEDALVMLSDILPTGYECGVLKAQIQPGDTVAVVGSGPVGLAALITAQFYAPGQLIVLDVDDKRLEFARKFGATHTVNSGDGETAVAKVMELTEGAGVDAAIEAVGIPATFELCQSIIAPGGTIAVLGVHGSSVPLHLERLWAFNIAITTRLVDTVTTPLLLKTVVSGRLKPEELITHRFRLNDILQAYDTFANAGREGALKVLMTHEAAG